MCNITVSYSSFSDQEISINVAIGQPFVPIKFSQLFIISIYNLQLSYRCLLSPILFNHSMNSSLCRSIKSFVYPQLSIGTYKWGEQLYWPLKGLYPIEWQIGGIDHVKYKMAFHGYNM